MLPTNWRVELNSVNVSDKVLELSDISSGLDIENPNQFNAYNMRLVLDNSTDISDLVFGNALVIRAGSELIFSGTVSSVNKDVKARTADVIVQDLSHSLRSSVVDNFGISKRVRLSQVGETTGGGEYPFTNILSPVSNESLDKNTARSGNIFSDTGIDENPITADDENHAIDFGKIEDFKIHIDPFEDPVEDGYIYTLSERLSYLRFQVDATISPIERVLVCRYSALPPDEDTVSTAGTVLFKWDVETGAEIVAGQDLPMETSTEGNISATKRLENPGAGLKFWFHVELPEGSTEDITSTEISNRRLRLEFGSGASSEDLNVVDSFISEGELIPNNITYDEETLRSEGSSLLQDPDITIKSPYRWKRIITLAEKIIEHYEIENSSIFAESIDVGYHFSSNGRVGYDLENNLDPNNTLAHGRETNKFWTGEVTDFIFQNNRFYFLYSSREEEDTPKIIEYNTLTDEYTEIFKRGTHAEWWRFQKSGNLFYILGTEKYSPNIEFPVLGAYDPTETNPETFIERVNISTDEIVTYISAAHTNKPVVGMYYQMGFRIDGANNDVRQGIQPDTRKGFILEGSDLYYIYANVSDCGIAKATAVDTASAFVTIPKDGLFNHLGLDFTIDSSVLYGAATFQGATNSFLKVFKKDLS